MKVTITIACGNAAFGHTLGEAADEVGRILTDAGEKVSGRNEISDVRLFDSNGNAVGEMTVSGASQWERERKAGEQ